MQWKSISRMSMATIPIMIVCGLLFAPSSSRVAASSPRADDGDRKVCSNRTLHGDYGSAVEGLILPAPGVALPIRGVVMTHYDGDGNFTQVDHIVANGFPPAIEWTPGSGTYHVNSDCTGTAHIDTSTGGFVNLEIVVVQQGKEVRAVVTAPFDGPNRTVTSVGIRVE
jgi:hypothetical protein